MLPNLYIFFHGNLLGQIKGGQKKKRRERRRKEEREGGMGFPYL